MLTRRRAAGCPRAASRRASTASRSAVTRDTGDAGVSETLVRVYSLCPPRRHRARWAGPSNKGTAVPGTLGRALEQGHGAAENARTGHGIRRRRAGRWLRGTAWRSRHGSAQPRQQGTTRDARPGASRSRGRSGPRVRRKGCGHVRRWRSLAHTRGGRG